ncbi:MAG: DUF1343 domain-containing protein [Ignavibacteriales bacterium]|nr:DUF1343 domain-containing protein [Ignavibacteriales bacterium]
MIKIVIFLLLLVPLAAGCQTVQEKTFPTKKNDFVNGIDNFLQKEWNSVAEKRLGIVANHTAVTSDGKHLVDEIIFDKKGKITAVFGPEHGFRGVAAAGLKIDNTTDEKTGIPVFSLYGKTRKPTPEMLEGIDLMIFSIRDAGVRFYTYISTLYHVMEACGEAGITVWVLDQPNIIGGLYVDGPVVEDSLFSFVGITRLPIAHGMTIGEIGKYFQVDIKERKGINCNLNVVEMSGYYRESEFEETGVEWLDPSPNLRSVTATKVYPGTCLLENTNVSEGRGSDDPFLIFGAPFINNDKLLEFIKQFPGIKSVEKIEYTPVESEAAVKPKFMGEKCFGVRIRETSKEFEAVKFGFYLLDHLNREYPDKFEIKERGFRIKSGRGDIQNLLTTKGWEAVVASWQEELRQFKELRSKYLLYTNLR